MKSVTLSLFKVIFKNSFSLFSISDSGSSKKPSKIILNSFLSILGISALLFFILSIWNSIYNLNTVLLSAQKQMYLPVITAALSCFYILFFGFISAAITYYNGYEELLLALPIQSKNLLKAKALFTTSMDIFWALIFVVISAVIYGSSNHLLKNPSFYFAELGLLLLILSITSFLVYFVLIVFLLVFKKLRNSNFLTGISTLLALTIALLVSNLVNSSSIFEINNFLTNISLKQAVTKIIKLIESNKILIQFSTNFTSNWLFIIFEYLLSALIIFGVFNLLSPLYLKTLDGFNTQKSKNLTTKQSTSTLKKTRHHSVTYSLYLRDIKNVIFEPGFFVNGPLGLIIISAGLILSVFVSLKNNADIPVLKYNLARYFLSLNFSQIIRLKYICISIIAILSLFAGNFTFISITTLTREGYQLSYLKSLPLDLKKLFKAKFLHALTYIFLAHLIFAPLISVLLVKFKFPFVTSEILEIYCYSLLLALIVSASLIFIGMFLDTYSPKLMWEFPSDALKHNPMVLLYTFILLIYMALAIAAFWFIKSGKSFLVVTGLFAVLCNILRLLYFKYAAKKLQDL